MTARLCWILAELALCAQLIMCLLSCLHSSKCTPGSSCCLRHTCLRASIPFPASLCTGPSSSRLARRFMNTSIGDLWIPALTLAGLVASFAFGLHKVISQGSVVTTLSISLLWILYRCAAFPCSCLFKPVLPQGVVCS